MARSASLRDDMLEFKLDFNDTLTGNAKLMYHTFPWNKMKGILRFT